VYVVLRESVLVSGGATGQGHPDEFLIINPVTGYVFSAADANCPLLEINMLATTENVYANVQDEAKPCKISFDITKNVGNVNLI